MSSRKVACPRACSSSPYFNIMSDTVFLGCHAITHLRKRSPCWRTRDSAFRLFPSCAALRASEGSFGFGLSSHTRLRSVNGWTSSTFTFQALMLPIDDIAAVLSFHIWTLAARRRVGEPVPQALESFRGTGRGVLTIIVI